MYMNVNFLEIEDTDMKMFLCEINWNLYQEIL